MVQKLVAGDVMGLTSPPAALTDVAGALLLLLVVLFRCVRLCVGTWNDMLHKAVAGHAIWACSTDPARLPAALTVATGVCCSV
jgi:hypothetical protein